MRRRDWPEARQRYRCLGGIQQAVYDWGPRSSSPAGTVVCLHGWMDAARAFAPLVANLSGTRRYLALDWRGFGASQRAPDGRYLIPDYLADLDELLDQELGHDEPVTLMGHSLGGNIAGLYAGIRPHRIQGLISLEGFGLPDSEPQNAPEQYAAWLDSQESVAERCFRSRLALARHIRQLNPRLRPAMAAHLADSWSAPDGQGGVVLRADPNHRRPNPSLYRLAEVLACWQNIEAPVLWLYGNDSRYAQRLQRDADWPQRLAAIDNLTLVPVPGTGHALLHEAPERLAELLEPHWPVS